MIWLRGFNNRIPNLKIYKGKVGAVFLIIIIALAIRLWKLSFHEFWYDEIMALSAARCPLKTWFPPLYFLFLHYWSKLFPFTPFWARLPSVIFDILDIFFLYLIAQKFWNKKVAIISSLLACFSPFKIWYAQEARPYILASFLTTINLYILWTLIKKESRLKWLFFSIFSILGLLASYFYIFVLLAEIIYLIRLKKFKLFYVLIILGGISYWLSPYFMRFFTIKYYGFWLPPPKINSLKITLENFVLGYNGNRYLYAIFDLILVLALIVLIYKYRRIKNIYFTSLIWIITFGLGSCFLFSRFVAPVYLDRQLIIFSNMFYLFLGIVINRKSAIFFFLFPLIVLSDFNYFGDNLCPEFHRVGVWPKKPMKPVITFIKKEGSPHHLYLVTHDHTLPLLYFYGFPYRVYLVFYPGMKMGTYKKKFQENLFMWKINDIQEKLTPEVKNIWVITLTNIWGYGGKISENARKVIEYLKKNFEFKKVKKIEACRVYIFELDRR